MSDKPEEKVELTVEEKTLKAKELYAKGCRNYYVKNYTEAADDLSDACELYGELFGLQGDELGEVYLLYAKALIAVGQEENKLLDIQEEEDDDENDETDEESTEIEEKDPVEKSNDPETKEDSKDNEEKPENSAADSKEPESELKNSETVKSDVLTNGDDKDESENPGTQVETSDPVDATETEEDGGNLEVAWEVLQNAAQIFERQNEKGLSNLLDVYNEMAGISIENGNFAVALEDYARAIATFDRIEESLKNYRIAAEIHYKVGLCQTLEKTYDESIKSFQKAHDLLSDVIEKEKSKEQTDEVAANIKDMEETKQEILNKINETGDIKADEVEKVLKELAKFYSKINTDNSKQQSSESASDISHLVKRKKPDVTDSNIESSPAKKQIIETEEAITAVPVDDEKKKIEEEEAVQPAIDN